jgi:uncharacterized protein YbjT (DUF2867 family)
VSNSATLFREGAAAGIRRVVHVSVANADLNSPYRYYRAKAEAEDALRSTGISHAVLRPTLVYGPQDILVSNFRGYEPP